MSQPTNTLHYTYAHRLPTPIYNALRNVKNLYYLSNSELFILLDMATTSTQLRKCVNKIQKRIWKLPAHKQTGLRQKLVQALSMHVLHAERPDVRLEAAGWLRMLMQAGQVAPPVEAFSVLITAATSALINSSEQKTYLKMIFDSFWPFRYPYPAFNWQDFPEISLFYPLATLFKKGDIEVQDILISIFTELPMLNDTAISDNLVPVALAWSKHTDPEHRQRITHILALLDRPEAQAMLLHLQKDENPEVRASARYASSSVRSA